MQVRAVFGAEHGLDGANGFIGRVSHVCFFMGCVTLPLLGRLSLLTLGLFLTHFHDLFDVMIRLGALLLSLRLLSST